MMNARWTKEAREGDDILVVGGYGEVGRRLCALLEKEHPGRVVAAGRNPERAGDARARQLDVRDRPSVWAALDGIGTVVACVRQPERYLLEAAVSAGIAYTSIAPPWMAWPALEPLGAEARRTGARIVLAAGIEPGISSVLARVAAERLGSSREVDAVETALLLGIGDAYGVDSMAFIFEELAQAYTITIDGHPEPVRAFDRSTVVDFPAPIGARRAYTMPFRDQLYYPHTLGARTAIARLALDPPWIGDAVAALARFGGRALVRRGGGRGALHGLVERLRRRYADRDRFALVVDVRAGDRLVRCTLAGHGQADATASGAAAVAEALHTGEVYAPGVWLAEQVVPPEPFLARLAARGLVPVIATSPAQSAPRSSEEATAPAP